MSKFGPRNPVSLSGDMYRRILMTPLGSEPKGLKPKPRSPSPRALRAVLGEGQEGGTPGTLPDQRDTSLLFLQIIQQALYDIVPRTTDGTWFPQACNNYPTERDGLSARAFLLDPDYRIDWGDKELSLSDICDYLEQDVELLRRKARLTLRDYAHSGKSKEEGEYQERRYICR